MDQGLAQNKFADEQVASVEFNLSQLKQLLQLKEHEQVIDEY
jgi:hypothetical protein